MDTRFTWYFTVAKDLRKLIELAREPLVRMLVPRTGSGTEAERVADNLLEVPETDLCQSEAITVEEEGHLTEQELELAMKTDYFELRKQVAIRRGLLSVKATEVLDRVLPFVIPHDSTSTDQLISEADNLLKSYQGCSTCIPFWQQLTQWLQKLQIARDDASLASATATALGAFADCLYKEKMITEKEFSRIQMIGWRFHRDL